MTSQTTPPENRALAESAQRVAQLKDFSVPVARRSYRIAGGLVAALSAWVLVLKINAARLSDSPVATLAAEDLGMLLLVTTLGLAFGFVALTGRVPEWLWKRMLRSGGNQSD